MKTLLWFFKKPVGMGRISRVLQHVDVVVFAIVQYYNSV